MATLEQIEQALRAADAAGNVEDARRLAQAYAQMRQQAPSRADFSQVSGEASTKPAATIGGKSVDEIPGWKRAAFGVASTPASLITGLGQMTGLMDPEQVRQSTARIDAIRDTPQGFGGGLVGDVASMAVPLSKVGALSRAGQYGASAGAGAAFAGLQPTREGEDRGANILLGGLLGAAGQKGAEVVGAVGKRAAAAITPEVRALYEAAKSRGINLTPAQLSDSRAVKFVQSILSRMPLAGRGAFPQQQAAFNRELAKEIGEDAPVVTPEVYARAKVRQSAQFEDLTSRNTLRVTDDLLQRLEGIKAEATMLGDDTAKAVSNAVDAFYARVGKGDTVPGRVYQSLDSMLGKASRVGNEAGHYLGQVRHAIQSAMDDSIAPADREAWRKLRQEYASRKTIRDLVARGDGGEISPASLSGRVNANNAGKERMASGNAGGLGELARIGQRIKEPQSSGTAERLGTLATGAGAVTNLPLTLAALLGGRVAQRGLDSNTLARLLLRDRRGQGAQWLAPYTRGALPGIGAPLVTDEPLDYERPY